MEMIGFVGLGTIGGAVAGNIRKAGYPMMVHDIRSAAVQPLGLAVLKVVRALGLCLHAATDV